MVASAMVLDPQTLGISDPPTSLSAFKTHNEEDSICASTTGSGYYFRILNTIETLGLRRTAISMPLDLSWCAAIEASIFVNLPGREDCCDL